MLAVIKTGGKQYLISPGQKIKIEKVDVALGEEITFKEVLLTIDGEDIKIGTPNVSGAQVKGKVLAHGKSDKTIVFKYKPKKRESKKKGHRQLYSEIEIIEVKG